MQLLKFFFRFFSWMCLLAFCACSWLKKEPALGQKHRFFLGADLSYVNEMEDCGARYRMNGLEKDPYRIFKEKGASIARFRLWHSPKWTNYSTLPDVKRSFRRAKAQGMRILLDFHYSDSWTDPARQTMPEAWMSVSSQEVLADSLAAYTTNVLLQLHQQGLLPEMVQIGNEINPEILQKTEKVVYPINWKRNVFLLNAGINAVKKVETRIGRKIETMLHIAQPDHVNSWMDSAQAYGVSNFDWIGLSYYPQWSKANVAEAGAEIAHIKQKFKKRIMVVETGFPFTSENADSANNMLDTACLKSGYPISIQGQRNFMIDLTKAVIKAGGEGVLYWEPAWISTPCGTRWGKGSHWDNAVFFDYKNQHEALPVFDFLSEKQY